MIDLRDQFTSPQGKKPTANVIGIAVHHSVTTTLPTTATEETEIAALKAVEFYHIDQAGFGLFAYHAATFPSGRIYQIGDFTGQRAHVAGRNHELVGIVCMGTFTEKRPNQLQMKAVGEGIRAIEKTYSKSLMIQGHNNWALPGNGTQCGGIYINGLGPNDWEEIRRADPTPEGNDLYVREATEANREFFRGHFLNGAIKVWTKSDIPGDLLIPDSAKSMDVCVTMRDGYLELKDGDSGKKAGFCGYTAQSPYTYRVFVGEDPKRTFTIEGRGVIDMIEVLGYYT